MVIESNTESNTELSTDSYIESNTESNTEMNTKMNTEMNTRSNHELSNESNHELSNESNHELSNESNHELSNESNHELSHESNATMKTTVTATTTSATPNTIKITITNPNAKAITKRNNNTLNTNAPTIANTTSPANPVANSHPINSNDSNNSNDSIHPTNPNSSNSSNPSNSTNLNVKSNHPAILFSTKSMSSNKSDECETESQSSIPSTKRNPEKPAKTKPPKMPHVELASADSEEECYPHHQARVGDRHQAVVSSFDSSVAQQTRQIHTSYEKIWDPTKLSDTDLDAFVGLFPTDALEAVYDDSIFQPVVGISYI